MQLSDKYFIVSSISRVRFIDIVVNCTEIDHRVERLPDPMIKLNYLGGSLVARTNVDGNVFVLESVGPDPEYDLDLVDLISSTIPLDIIGKKYCRSSDPLPGNEPRKW